MAHLLTPAGEFDLSAIMAFAWSESSSARRMCGTGNHPAVVAERRRRFATFLKRAWAAAKYQKARFNIEAARLAAEAGRRAAIPVDERASRVVALRETLAAHEFSDSRDYMARRAVILNEISRLAA